MFPLPEFYKKQKLRTAVKIFANANVFVKLRYNAAFYQITIS